MSEDILVQVGRNRYRIKTDRRYTKTDEWAKMEDGKIREGLTDYAQKELRDIVGIELPEVGRECRKGESIGVVESIKATADIYAAVSGRIVEVNEKLAMQPELINKDPYGEGWIVVIEPSNPKEYEELLTPEEYAEHVKKHA